MNSIFKGLLLGGLVFSQVGLAATLSGTLKIQDKKNQPVNFCDQAVVFLEPRAM